MGAFVEAADHGQVAIALAEEIDHPYSLAIACLGLGDLHAVRVEWERAASVLDRGLSVARDLTLRVATSQLASTLGLVHVRRGGARE